MLNQDVKGFNIIFVLLVYIAIYIYINIMCICIYIYIYMHRATHPMARLSTLFLHRKKSFPNAQFPLLQTVFHG